MRLDFIWTSYKVSLKDLKKVRKETMNCNVIYICVKKMYILIFLFNIHKKLLRYLINKHLIIIDLSFSKFYHLSRNLIHWRHEHER